MLSAHLLGRPRSALSIDGNADSSAGATRATFTITLTTTKPNNIIFVIVEHNGAVGAVTDITSASGLVFQRRTDNANSGNELELWWAVAPGILTADVITVNLSNVFSQGCAFAVNGANVSRLQNSIFDKSATLPAHVTSGLITINTAAHDVLVFGSYRGNPATPGSGWTSLSSLAFMVAEYKIVMGAQIGLLVDASLTSGAGGFADAVVAAGSV
jgi:hypothetical protein